jgi:predicted  nucleic acid-binding Zn-ribbon protein
MATRLKINRLLGHCKKTTEVPLRDGLCIIQGTNSSGKTSLIRIIDYLFGGESRFIAEIKQACQWVAADLNFGETRVLIERSVQEEKAPIKVYSLDESGNRTSEALELKPAQIEDTLLAHLGIPKVRSYTDSTRANNITFGNLWKMMYVDQKKGWSDIQGSQETAYNPKLKQFVIEVLLDLDRVRQYEIGVQKTEIQKQIALLSTEAANIQSFLSYFPDIPRKPELEKRLKKLEARREELEAAVAKIKQDLTSKTQYAEPIREKREQIRASAGDVRDDIAAIDLRLQDILLASNDLKTQLEKNRQLHQARKIFADIPVEHCPRCLSELEAARIAAHSEQCYVCGKPYRSAHDENASFAQNLHLLADEQKEIEHLKATYQEELDGKRKELAKLSGEFEQVSGQLNLITSDAISPAMETFEENMRVLGDVKGEISQAQHSIKMWVECEKKQSRLLDLKKEAEQLKLKLKELSAKSSNDQAKVDEFQQLIYGLLKRMGLQFQKVEIGSDYVPVVDGKNYLADGGGSSEKVRIILAFYTALLELSLRRPTNFPGILIFDTPIQHELDPKDFKELCLYWKELEEQHPGKFQILVTGNYFPSEVDYAVGDRRYDRDKGKYTIDLS